MNKDQFKGILPAMMTAFTDDGIDCKKIQAHIGNLKAAGVHGLYVGGSSGEMVLCSQKERMELLETTMEASGDLTIIAHITPSPPRIPSSWPAMPQSAVPTPFPRSPRSTTSIPSTISSITTSGSAMPPASR